MSVALIISFCGTKLIAKGLFLGEHSGSSKSNDIRTELCHRQHIKTLAWTFGAMKNKLTGDQTK